MHNLSVLLFSHGFKFQNFVYNTCLDVKTFFVNVSDIAIITTKGVDYRCIIHGVSKSEAINVLKTFLLDVCWYI